MREIDEYGKITPKDAEATEKVLFANLEKNLAALSATLKRECHSVARAHDDAHDALKKLKGNVGKILEHKARKTKREFLRKHLKGGSL